MKLHSLYLSSIKLYTVEKRHGFLNILLLKEKLCLLIIIKLQYQSVVRCSLIYNCSSRFFKIAYCVEYRKTFNISLSLSRFLSFSPIKISPGNVTAAFLSPGFA